MRCGKSSGLAGFSCGKRSHEIPIHIGNGRQSGVSAATVELIDPLRRYLPLHSDSNLYFLPHNSSRLNLPYPTNLNWYLIFLCSAHFLHLSC